MSQISIVLKKRLKDSMNASPLGDAEIRVIPGVDGHCFSRLPTHEGHKHLFSADIDGVTVYIYKIPE